MGPGKDTLGTPVPTQWGGREWPAQAAQPVTHRVRDGHRTRYTANIVAEQCRSNARALMTSADCCKKLSDEDVETILENVDGDQVLKTLMSVMLV